MTPKKLRWEARLNELTNKILQLQNRVATLEGLMELYEINQLEKEK